MKRIGLIALILSSSIFLTGCTSSQTPEGSSAPSPSQANIQEKKSMSSPQVLSVSPDMIKENNKVRLTLENGLTFTITLYPKVAPKTTENYLQKFSSGYYNNLTFHRVENWVVQGGDPLGNGTGGGKIPTELNDRPFKKGSVGVARGADIANSNDSQFFIVTTDADFLNKQYTYLGEVTEGLENVLKIKVGDKIKSVTIL